MERLPTGDGANANAEPAAVLAFAADEALAEVRSPATDEALARGLGLHHGDGSGRLDVESCSAALRNNGVSVAENRQLAFRPYLQRPGEWRRKTKRDLDDLARNECREAPARIASVGRRERSTKSRVERDVHGGDCS
jgi:hypothetical protein